MSTDKHSDPMPESDPDGRVADATRLNWVDRFCPVWSRPYLRLSRADRPAGTWLLLIPCWWGLALAVAARGEGWGWQDLQIGLACAFGAFLMRGAGCTWNDVSDRKIDAQVARTRSRPLPSGQVTVNGALYWMVVQALIAFAILLTFNRYSIWLGIAALLPVAVYPFAKRFTWWPQVFLGIAFNWGALLGWSAVTGGLTLAPVLLYLGGISWTLFYDTIYAHQDKEDDALIGVRSTARLFGAATGRWLLLFLVATVVLITLSAILALSPARDPLSLILALAGIWGMGWHLSWQLRRLNPDDPDLCLNLFRSNRETGLILTLGLVAAGLLTA